MKRVLISLLFILLLTSVASAEIIITQQPGNSYSLGEVIEVPVTIKTVEETVGILSLRLLCSGNDVEFYKNGVNLNSGEEKVFTPSLILEPDTIENLRGDCSIKASLKGQYTLSSNFQISDLITITLTEKPTEIGPGETLVLEGNAQKEGGKAADGFIRLELLGDGNESIIQEGTVKNGFFNINLSLDPETRAGKYLAKIDVYEKTAGDVKTNKGFLNYNLQITQIPTNIEVVFETSMVEPGTMLRTKAILHDQTGENIEGSTAIITIKNPKDKIMEQVEITTDEFLEFAIENSEPPAKWKVVAVSTQLTDERTFNISEKKEVAIEIINRTLRIKNIGNVRYEDMVVVKIGGETLNINLSLEREEEREYILSAPDGEYQVDVMGVSESVMLTGNAISIKELRTGAIAIVRHPLSWVFIIILLGLTAYVIYTRATKKSFFGYVTSRAPRNSKPLGDKSIVKASNKAVLSLSIKGDKQKASVICVKINNLSEVQSQKGKSEETLQKMVNLAEEKNAMTYESQDSIFFILSPSITKTFDNEKPAINIAQHIKRIINEHNKLYKDRISFGISVNLGTIIAKKDPEGQLKFMSMGTLMNQSRKIAALAKGEVLLDEKMHEKTIADVRTEKKQTGGIKAYSIQEVKQQKKENKKFIRNFINRLEGESKNPVAKTEKKEDEPKN
jgi:hypothetical protein